MRRYLVVVLLSACAGRVMAPKDWRDQAPAAPCEVAETYTDAMATNTRISKYSGDGRLLFAQTQLTYDGHGFEHVTWNNGRVVRIDSYYENAFRQGLCDVEGGCDEPAYRTVDTSTYRYDSSGRWTDVDHETVEYRQRGDAWVSHRSTDDEVRYVYKSGRLVATKGNEKGGAKLRWQNGHPVERQFDGRRSTYEWTNDRLVMYRWFDYAQSFEYDHAGRLVREVLASKSGEPTVTDWIYDAAGRVISETPPRAPRRARPRGRTTKPVASPAPPRTAASTARSRTAARARRTCGPFERRRRSSARASCRASGAQASATTPVSMLRSDRRARRRRRCRSSAARR